MIRVLLCVMCVMCVGSAYGATNYSTDALLQYCIQQIRSTTAIAAYKHQGKTKKETFAALQQQLTDEGIHVPITVMTVVVDNVELIYSMDDVTVETIEAWYNECVDTTLSDRFI